VYGGSGGERFRLNNSEHEYIFESKMSYLNNEYPFSEAAEIGDSVFKSSFSDTLTLIKKSGKIYKYTFHESYNFGQRK